MRHRHGGDRLRLDRLLSHCQERRRDGIACVTFELSPWDCRVASALETIFARRVAQFEIRIDGTPRTYRDRKDFAMEVARLIKSKNPHSMVGVKDLKSGDVTAVALRPV